ncbi:WD repeat-containing protein WRAP73 [Trichonephila clavipes]|nr:WD repeat-containing protein WRAP73 [Trichonephila clavipes]
MRIGTKLGSFAYHITLYLFAKFRDCTLLPSWVAIFNVPEYEVVKHRPFALPSLASQSERSKTKHVKYGIQTLQYSSCNQYLASLNGLFPKVLFVLDLRSLRLSSIVVHQHKIKEISWHPQKPILAFSSGSENVDLWTPSSCISVKSPFKGEFPVINAKWCSKDDCLLLNGKGYSSVLYLPNFSSKDLVIS